MCKNASISGGFDAPALGWDPSGYTTDVAASTVRTAGAVHAVSTNTQSINIEDCIKAKDTAASERAGRLASVSKGIVGFIYAAYSIKVLGGNARTVVAGGEVVAQDPCDPKPSPAVTEDTVYTANDFDSNSDVVENRVDVANTVGARQVSVLLPSLQSQVSAGFVVFW
jgi:hypothetical protein